MIDFKGTKRSKFMKDWQYFLMIWKNWFDKEKGQSFVASNHTIP